MNAKEHKAKAISELDAYAKKLNAQPVRAVPTNEGTKMKQRIGNYEIEASDDKNYTVSKVNVIEKGDNKGEESFVVVGYYNSITNAVKEVARRVANKQAELIRLADQMGHTVKR